MFDPAPWDDELVENTPQLSALTWAAVQAKGNTLQSDAASFDETKNMKKRKKKASKTLTDGRMESFRAKANNLTAKVGGTGPGWKLIQDHQHSIVWGARLPTWSPFPSLL